MPVRCTRSIVCCFAVAAAVTACSGGTPPRLAPLRASEATVGVTLRIPLRANEPDGDDVEFSVWSTLGNLVGDGAIVPTADGQALFQWTPQAHDVGEHLFQFSATDPDGVDSIAMVVNVIPGSGGEGAPVFREPLGTGIVFAPATSACVEVDVLVEDNDSTEIEVGTASELPDSTLALDADGRSGVWRWCPQPDTLDQTYYELVLTADDGDHPVVTKEYHVVVHGEEATCPDALPRIEHELPTAAGVPVEIVADVSSDTPLAAPPVVLVSDEDPGELVEPGELAPRPMELVDGDDTQGRWRTELDPPATGESIYYVITATAESTQQGCAATTNEPPEGFFVVDGSAADEPADCPNGTCQTQGCCSEGAGPGCDDATLQACVCAIDSFCCEHVWDAMCVAQVDESGCGACNPDDQDGSCCTANGTPGCNVDAKESCVCATDPYCCDQAWDDLCVSELVDLGCGNCPG